jgi:hypothetical protein
MTRRPDTMTQRHQRTFTLHAADGAVLLETGSRRKAAKWHAMCRAVPREGWHVTTSLTCWFASQRTDADNHERWHAHRDDRHGP